MYSNHNNKCQCSNKAYIYDIAHNSIGDRFLIDTAVVASPDRDKELKYHLVRSF